METFEQWMLKVDQQVIAKSGLSVHDLADAPFRDMYDDETDPAEAADQILIDNGWAIPESA